MALPNVAGKYAYQAVKLLGPLKWGKKGTNNVLNSIYFTEIGTQKPSKKFTPSFVKYSYSSIELVKQYLCYK